MSYIAKLADIEGGPYPPVTTDEIERHVEVLRQRVHQAVRSFLINVSAGEAQRKETMITMAGALSDLVDCGAGLQLLELEG